MEEQKTCAEYTIRNLITGKVLCDMDLVPLKFGSRNEAEIFIDEHGLCSEHFGIAASNFMMKVAWGNMEFKRRKI